MIYAYPVKFLKLTEISFWDPLRPISILHYQDTSLVHYVCSKYEMHHYANKSRSTPLWLRFRYNGSQIWEEFHSDVTKAASSYSSKIDLVIKRPSLRLPIHPFEATYSYSCEIYTVLNFEIPQPNFWPVFWFQFGQGLEAAMALSRAASLGASSM